MPDNRVVFTPNIPQEIAFKSEGEFEIGPLGDIVRFDLVDGRTMYLTPDVAAKISMMDIQPGETFHLCKYYGGPRKRALRWNIWLSPETEQARALAEQDQTAALLEQSIQFVRSSTNGTALPRALEPLQSPETPGLPIPASVIPPAKRTPPGLPKVAIPWNVAFREVSAWVAAELKANNLQWSDAAQQDLCSTVLIASAKTGLIGPWERQ